MNDIRIPFLSCEKRLLDCMMHPLTCKMHPDNFEMPLHDKRRCPHVQEVKVNHVVDQPAPNLVV